jgi:hypothetical protein
MDFIYLLKFIAHPLLKTIEVYKWYPNQRLSHFFKDSPHHPLRHIKPVFAIRGSGNSDAVFAWHEKCLRIWFGCLPEAAPSRIPGGRMTASGWKDRGRAEVVIDTLSPF